jgi:hypothetical protein
MDLPVKACVAARQTTVSVASGNEMVLAVVKAVASVPLMPVVFRLHENLIDLVGSVVSAKKLVAVVSVLFVNESVVARPISVSVLVGRVSVPVRDCGYYGCS